VAVQFDSLAVRRYVSRIYIKTADRIKLVFGCLGLSYIALEINLGFSKNKSISLLWNFVPKSGVRKMSPWHVDGRECSQPTSTDACRQFVPPTSIFVYNTMGVEQRVAWLPFALSWTRHLQLGCRVTDFLYRIGVSQES